MNTPILPPPGISSDRVGDDLVLLRRTGSVRGAAFMLAWLGIWTVACVAIIVKLGREPTLEHALFATPFLVGWVVGCFACAVLLFGFERMRVGPDGLDYSSLGERRLIPLGEVQVIARYRRTYRDEDGEKAEVGLIVRSSGRPLRFGRGLEEEGRQYLVDEILGRLRELVPSREFALPEERPAKPGNRVEVLVPGDPIPGPPSDCSIRPVAVAEGVEFVRRGKIRGGLLAMITAWTLFWDGGLGVFILQLTKEFDWGLFLFLIPFALVGLASLVFWVLALLSPGFLERWRIGPRGSSARWSFLGLGRTRNLDPSELWRVELRQQADDPEKPNDTPYSLAFVGQDASDRIVLDDMTEGEARWVGGLACDQLKGVLSPGRSRAQAPRTVAATLWDREFDT